jgi:hypothetical protein
LTTTAAISALAVKGASCRAGNASIRHRAASS